MDRDPPYGTLSALSCPECSGPLWESREGELLHYRCRVGHAFTGETMAASQAEALDEALWTAYNTLRESMEFSERLAREAHAQGHTAVARRFEARHAQHRRHAEIILRVLSEGDDVVPVPSPSGNVSAHPDERDTPPRPPSGQDKAPAQGHQGEPNGARSWSATEGERNPGA